MQVKNRFSLAKTTLVLLIVFILFSIIVVNYIFPIEGPRSQDSSRAAFAEIIRNALELYRGDNGKYPETMELLVPEYLKEIKTFNEDKPIYDYDRVGDLEYKLCVEHLKWEDKCLSSP